MHEYTYIYSALQQHQPKKKQMAMAEIRNLKFEIDQLRVELHSRSFQGTAGQPTAASGRRRAGMLYGGRAYSGDFCD